MHHQKNWLHIHDDVMFYITGAASFFDREKLDAMNSTILSKHQEDGSKNLETRFQTRDDFMFDYLAWRSTVALFLSRTEATDDQKPHNVREVALSSAIAGSIPLATLTLFFLGLIILICTASSDRTMLFALLPLSMLAGLEQVYDIGATNTLFIPNEVGGPGFKIGITVKRLFYLLFDSGNSTSLWGAAPRNFWQVLLLSTFVLRWRNKIKASYFMLVLMALTHQSLTLLFLPWIITIDLLLRPGIFKERALTLGLAGLIAVSIYKHNNWEILFDQDHIIPFVGFSGLALLFIATFHRVAFGERAKYKQIWFQRMIMALHQFRSARTVTSDTVILVLLWLSFFTMTGVVNYFVEANQSLVFWSHIAGRMLGVLRPIFLLAIFLTLIDRFWIVQRLDHAHLKSSIAATLLLGAGVVFVMVANISASVSSTIINNEKQIEKLSSELTIPLENTTYDKETLIYLAITKSLLLGQDHLSPIVPLESAKKP